MLYLINKIGFGDFAHKILQHTFLNFKEFLMNHHKNIVIILISQKFGGKNQLVGGQLS